MEVLQDRIVTLEKFKTSAYVEVHGLLKEIQLTSDQHGKFIHIYFVKDVGGVFNYDHRTAKSVVAAFAEMSEFFPSAVVYLPTVKVDVDGDAQQLCELARTAWASTFAVAEGKTLESMHADMARNELIQARLAVLKEKLFLNLTGAEERIQYWNESRNELSNVDWSNTKVSGLTLKGVRLSYLIFDGSNFDDANMENAELIDTNLRKASFRSANLEGAVLNFAVAQGADFTDARLTKATLKSAALSKCIFENADLTGADLTEADLRGVDLRTACVVEAKFDQAFYDEATCLPENFQSWSKLVWKGKGVDPYKQLLKEKISNTNVNNFDEFMAHLQEHFDRKRLDKVFQMLKKERFQLFSEINDTSVLGVVKSQTDPDLVYACRLGTDGSFMCCTQNLKACGGLRGALCKHLLVLVIGLAKANELDLNKVVKWILASTLETAAINKPILTEVFLRYKGCAAGEIDWRPTETIPEDYYAF